jgi:HAD superfamily hydrolase (TIGR01509 family)
MNMTPLSALLFDVDGTLADTERDGHRIAFNAAFQEHHLGWEWDVALYGQLLAVTGGKERIRYYVRDHLPDYQPPKDFDDLVVALHRSKTRHYAELLEQGKIPVRPGVKRLLAEARAAGLRLAIVTTTTPENVTALLQFSLGAESMDWFELIAAGDIVPAKKPAPDIYQWALEKMQLPASACMAFEDSFNGLRSSLGAHIPTLITLNDYTFDHDFTGACAVLSDLGEANAPAQVLSGHLHGHHHVTLDTVRTLHAHAAASSVESPL